LHNILAVHILGITVDCVVTIRLVGSATFVRSKGHFALIEIVGLACLVRVIP
jgi:hypothetical protein